MFRRVPAVSDGFHNFENETEATCHTLPLVAEKVSQVALPGLRNDVEIVQNALLGMTFSDNGPYAIRSRLRGPNTI